MKKNHLIIGIFMLLFVSNVAFAQNKAYGDNLVAVDTIAGSPVFAIYSGDLNQDGSIDAFDFLDMDPDIQEGNSGYLVSDDNGDGYTDAFDFLVLDPNIQAGITIQRPY